MAGSTDFVPFATGAGANVTPQAAWIAEPTTGTGFQSGVAPSADCNKAWRQGSFQASVLANFVANELGINVPDNGDLTTAIVNLQNAVANVVHTNNAATATVAASATIALSVASEITSTEPVQMDIALLNGNIIYQHLGLYYLPSTNTLNFDGGFDFVSGNCSSFFSVTGSLKVGSAYGALNPGDFGIALNSAPTTGTIYIGELGTSYLTFNGTTYVFGGGFGVDAASFNVISDRNLKYDIVEITDSGTIIDAITGVRFKHKGSNQPRAGVIAQDVETVLAEAVHTGVMRVTDKEEPHKTVDFSALVGVLIQEVKELRKRVATLEAR